MHPIEELIAGLEEPLSIREALAASSPYSLKTAFDLDKRVQELIKSKEEVEKYILKRLENKTRSELDDISEACLYYVLGKRNAKGAVKRLSEALAERRSKADRHEFAFAPLFAVNAVKIIEKQDDVRADLSYSAGEMEETLQRLQTRGRK